MHPTNTSALRVREQGAFSLVGLTAAVWRTLMTWYRRASERSHLAELDDRMLKDIGITRTDAARECRKPFWVA